MVPVAMFAPLMVGAFVPKLIVCVAVAVSPPIIVVNPFVYKLLPMYAFPLTSREYPLAGEVVLLTDMFPLKKQSFVYFHCMTMFALPAAPLVPIAPPSYPKIVGPSMYLPSAVQVLIYLT